jgi:hypothetical protein
MALRVMKARIESDTILMKDMSMKHSTEIIDESILDI